MDFVELQVNISIEYAEIMIAELADVGYESFIDTDYGFNAYILSDIFEVEAVKQLREQYKDLFPFDYISVPIEKQNWNEEWEKNYTPIIIADKCIIRASFHKIEKKYPYEIVINPQMSFGTGHHETTALVIENQFSIDHRNQHVLDVGCGTGILAVMACKLGAVQVEAFDIDEWAVENSKQNFELNDCTPFNLFKGTIDDLKTNQKYGIILANINRNILLKEIPAYETFMMPQGYLIVSGFYEQDMEDIEEIAQQVGLKKCSYKSKNNWTSIVFQKA